MLFIFNKLFAFKSHILHWLENNIYHYLVLGVDDQSLQREIVFLNNFYHLLNRLISMRLRVMVVIQRFFPAVSFTGVHVYIMFYFWIVLTVFNMIRTSKDCEWKKIPTTIIACRRNDHNKTSVETEERGDRSRF